MIASARGLIVLSVIAAALGLAVIVDRPGGAEVVDRRLAPALDRDRVTRVELTGGGDDVVVARDASGWQVLAPAPGPADPAAIADLIGALVAARWERRVPDAGPAQTGLDHPTRVVTLAGAAPAATIAIRFGRDVDGADQTWARVDDGPPLLVPSWVAHAAARDPGALRRTQLVRTRPDELTGVELHGRGVDLVLSGATPRVHLAGGAARVRAALVDRLAHGLAALRPASFPAGPAASAVAAGAPPAGLTVRVLGGAAPDELDERGPCPGRAGFTWLDGSAGPVCVDDAQLAAVVDAARAIAAGADAIDPSPLRHARLASLEWPRGDASVAIAGGRFLLRRQADDKGTPSLADDDAVRAAVDALTAAATVEPLPAGATAAAPSVIARYDDGDDDELDLVATPTGPALHRRGEPFLLRVAPAAAAAARLGFDDLRDRTLILEEPAALARVDVTAGARHAHAERGAVIGEWTGELDPAAVSAAAETIAHLRAAGPLDDAALGAIRLRIDATFAAPPVQGGQATHHTIELGAPGADRCLARVDGRAARLDPARCAALAALAPR